VFSLFFAMWHVPVIYQAALMNPTLHHVEHLVFLLTAVMLWWPILSPLEELPRAPYLVRLAYLFTIPIAQLPVFAGITFHPDVVYPIYAMAPRAFGLDAMADQALAGAIMKVFGLFFFGLPFARIFFEWYQRENGRRVTQIDMRATRRGRHVSDARAGSRAIAFDWGGVFTVGTFDGRAIARLARLST
jgi:putative membrane protein